MSTTRHLHVSYRKGKPIAAYLYFSSSAKRRAVRTEDVGDGLLVDYDVDGRALGIEMTAPSVTTLDGLNTVLEAAGELALEEVELHPLRVPELVEAESESKAKDLYAWFGATTYKAQLFEQELINILILCKRLSQKSLSRDEIDQIDNDLTSRTLGTLLKELKRHVKVEDSFARIFQEALEKRNYLVHGFYSKNATALLTEKGRIELTNELKEMRATFQEADESAEIIRALLMKVAGWAPERFEDEVERIIKEERSKYV